MIVRAWRGRAAVSRADGYATHFRRDVLPALEKLDGFLGALLLRQVQGREVEFLVLTRWASLGAVRAFAGDDIDRAVVEPEAAAILLSFDKRVHHYEIAEETRIEPRRQGSTEER